MSDCVIDLVSKLICTSVPEYCFDYSKEHGRIQRGGGARGGPDPLEKSQKYGVSWQYLSGSPKKYKATKPAFNGGPMMAHF